LLQHRTPRASVTYGLTVGVLAALAHLTKASMLMLVELFCVVYGVCELALLRRTGDLRAFGWRALAGLVLAISFLGVLYPYIATSKRIHGEYFYNLGPSALIWYDGWGQAGAALQSYAPNGWPPGPRSMRPGLGKYWREHTLNQIAGRFLHGFRDMVVRSYDTFWYMKFVVAYLFMAGLVMVTRRRTFTEQMARHTALVWFCISYAVLFLAAIAFYEPTSGTGTTRFLLAHIAPLLFTVSMLLSCETVREQRWTLNGVAVTPRHFHLLISATLMLDLAFTVWPRLMTTYGGF